MENQHNLVKKIFATTGSSYDAVVTMTTLWQDRRWKKRILEIADLCENPQRILDLACGTGILTCALARKFPNSTVVGVDLQEEYLEYARAKKMKCNIKNVEFYQGSAEETKGGNYDLITASYLPKYVDIHVVVGNCSRMMNPGGLFIFHDFVYPDKEILRKLYRLYWFFLKPLLQVSEPWRVMSSELKGIIQRTQWVSNTHEALEKYGFTNVQVEIQRFQVAAIVYAVKE